MALTERQLSKGVTILELNDHNIGVLVFALLIGQTWVYEIRHNGLLAIVMWELAVLIGLTALYLFTRKQTRIVIDPVKRVIRVNETPIAMDQILHAEIATKQREKKQGDVGDPEVFHRVEVVMRSGERIPTISGFGQFSFEDCDYLHRAINAAVGVR